MVRARGEGDGDRTSRRAPGSLTSTMSGHSPSGEQSGGSDALWELGRHNTNDSI